MRLPNSERALVELAKLADYCLDPSHLRGQHKARVFASRLGLGRNDAGAVRAALLEAANQAENVVRGAIEGFGSRYILDFRLSGPKGSATVRSAWIVRVGEDFPRFTSCYVL
jgi:hypothetical protein